jgi:curved DNA-binding protein CbpA
VANSQDLEKLCQGPKVWNAWREENPGGIPDLRDLRLTLSQRQLGPSNGGPVNFQNVDLDGAEFRNATLIGADFRRANLVAADLVHARLDGADLTGADLTDAVLDYADLTGANLEGAILVGASFANARGLTHEQIAAAYGNSSTVLPATLLPPETWFPTFDDEAFEGYPAPPPIFNNDPYDVLGVERPASQDEIRTAFRNLVKKVHPDLNPDDAEAQETFKRVSIAYRILSNPDTRARYDRGEIDGEGEVSREFEARRQFRRYAFRFYAAAAGSLLLAVGALGGVWYTFLTHDGAEGNRLEIAVGAPPKHSDRLSSLPSPAHPTKIAVASAESEDTDAPASPKGSTTGNSEQDTISGNQSETAEDEAGAERKTAMAEIRSATSPDIGSENRPAAGAEATTADEDDESPNTVADERGPGAEEKHNTARPYADDKIVETAADYTNRARRPSASGDEPLAKADAGLDEGGEKMASLTDPGDAQAPEASAASPVTQPETNLLPEESQAGAQPAATEPRTAAPGAPPEVEEKDILRPLGQSHRRDDARPAQADAARSGTAEKREGEARAGEDLASTAFRRSLHSEILLRKTNGRKLGQDPISELFRQHAIQEALAPDEGQATASVDGVPTAEHIDEEDEVWDVYTHSVPDQGQSAGRPWPSILKTKRLERDHLSTLTPAVPVRAKVTAGSPKAITGKPSKVAVPQPEPALRKQAVSDILTGGL